MTVSLRLPEVCSRKESIQNANGKVRAPCLLAFFFAAGTGAKAAHSFEGADSVRNCPAAHHKKVEVH